MRETKKNIARHTAALPQVWIRERAAPQVPGPFHARFRVETEQHARRIDDVYGIEIVPWPCGLVYRFDFGTLLLSVTTSLTLLAIANVITNLLARIYVNDTFRRVKFYDMDADGDNSAHQQTNEKDRPRRPEYDQIGNTLQHGPREPALV